MTPAACIVMGVWFVGLLVWAWKCRREEYEDDCW